MNPTSTTNSSLPPADVLTADAPSLENGDRLTRGEFERRYSAATQIKKAELIEGVVHMPSPARFSAHAEPHAHLVAWLSAFQARTPGTRVGDNATLRLDLDNEPQPDALLFLDSQHGGMVRISADGYLEGPPELVVEVAASSVSIDLHAKFHVYRRNQVREYLVWRVEDRAVDWFVLRGGEYHRQSTDDNGILRSHVFPGLWLDTQALLRGDMATVLATLEAARKQKDEG